jgi:predicted transcriptional regulator
MTYKTGTIGAFARWTKEVVRDPKAARNAPKQWYDSEKTARRAHQDSVSAEALVKLLSAENLALLRVLARQRPESLRRLAELTGRKESNLSRTLKKLEKAGIVVMTPGPGRTRRPTLIARKILLELDLRGERQRVAVDADA